MNPIHWKSSNVKLSYIESENCVNEDKCNSEWFVMLCKSIDEMDVQQNSEIKSMASHEVRRLVAVTTLILMKILRPLNINFTEQFFRISEYISRLAPEIFSKISMPSIKSFDFKACGLSNSDKKNRSVIVHDTVTRLNYGLFDTAHSLFIG